jgi:hypothetical protein
LVPGTYVNPWPRFTVTYPKDWVEQQGRLGEVFRAKAPGSEGFPSFGVFVYESLPPLDKVLSRIVMNFQATDPHPTVVGDKPSQLRDGTPAREVELQMVYNGAPLYTVSLVTKKGDTQIETTARLLTGRIGEDLKAILYSLKYEPGKDEPIKVPPDVQEFLDGWRNAYLARDLAQFMSNYSDRYLT